MKLESENLNEPQNQQLNIGAVISRITKLELDCEQQRYWLSDGNMSNPMKIRWRKRDLKNAQKEISELRSKYGL